MSRWHTLRHLSPADRFLLIEAALLVLIVRLALWLLPFRKVRLLLQKLEPRFPAPGGAEKATLKRVAWAIKAASRLVPAATCLTQALAAQMLLHRSGLAPRLHIGVAKDGNSRLLAHAWVEIRGCVVVGGTGLKRYAHLLVIEGEGT